MTDIEKLARMAVDLMLIDDEADEIVARMRRGSSRPLHPDLNEADISKLHQHAALQRQAIENAICFLQPDTVGDVMSQFLCLINRVLESELSGENAAVVDLGFQNMLAGMKKLAGEQASPLLKIYEREDRSWGARASKFLKIISAGTDATWTNGATAEQHTRQEFN